MIAISLGMRRHRGCGGIKTCDTVCPVAVISITSNIEFSSEYGLVMRSFRFQGVFVVDVSYLFTANAAPERFHARNMTHTTGVVT